MERIAATDGLIDQIVYKLYGLTQEELAARAGISPAAISLLERGLTQAPQKATVRLLSAALSLTPEEEAVFIAAAQGGPRAQQPGKPTGATPASDHGGALPLPLTPVNTTSL